MSTNDTASLIATQKTKIAELLNRVQALQTEVNDNKAAIAMLTTERDDVMRQHTDLVADHDNKMKTLQDQVTELERLYNVAQQDAAVARDENRRLSEAAGAAEKQLAALQSALAGDAHWAALFAEIRKLEPTWAPGDAFQAAARVAMELTLPAPEYGADEPL